MDAEGILAAIIEGMGKITGGKQLNLFLRISPVGTDVVSLKTGQS